MKKLIPFINLAILTNLAYSQSIMVHKKDKSVTTIQLSAINSITFTTSGNNQFIVFDRNVNSKSDIFIGNIDGTNIINLNMFK
jgi:hypothetical protein